MTVKFNDMTVTGGDNNTGDGGNMYVANADVLINRVIIENGSAVRNGGNIAIGKDGAVISTNSSILNGTAILGGGVFEQSEYASFLALSTTIAGNATGSYSISYDGASYGALIYNAESGVWTYTYSDQYNSYTDYTGRVVLKDMNGDTIMMFDTSDVDSSIRSSLDSFSVKQASDFAGNLSENSYALTFNGNDYGTVKYDFTSGLWLYNFKSDTCQYEDAVGLIELQDLTTGKTFFFNTADVGNALEAGTFEIDATDRMLTRQIVTVSGTLASGYIVTCMGTQYGNAVYDSAKKQWIYTYKDDCNDINCAASFDSQTGKWIWSNKPAGSGDYITIKDENNYEIFSFKFLDMLNPHKVHEGTTSQYTVNGLGITDAEFDVSQEAILYAASGAVHVENGSVYLFNTTVTGTLGGTGIFVRHAKEANLVNVLSAYNYTAAESLNDIAILSSTAKVVSTVYGNAVTVDGGNISALDNAKIRYNADLTVDPNADESTATSLFNRYEKSTYFDHWVPVLSIDNATDEWLYDSPDCWYYNAAEGSSNETGWVAVKDAFGNTLFTFRTADCDPASASTMDDALAVASLSVNALDSGAYDLTVLNADYGTFSYNGDKFVYNFSDGGYNQFVNYPGDEQGNVTIKDSAGNTLFVFKMADAKAAFDARESYFMTTSLTLGFTSQSASVYTVTCNGDDYGTVTYGKPVTDDSGMIKIRDDNGDVIFSFRTSTIAGIENDSVNDATVTQTISLVEQEARPGTYDVMVIGVKYGELSTITDELSGKETFVYNYSDGYNQFVDYTGDADGNIQVKDSSGHNLFSFNIQKSYFAITNNVSTSSATLTLQFEKVSENVYSVEFAGVSYGTISYEPKPYGTVVAVLSETTRANGGYFIATNTDANGVIQGAAYSKTADFTNFTTVYGSYADGNVLVKDQIGQKFIDADNYGSIGAYAAQSKFGAVVTTSLDGTDVPGSFRSAIELALTSDFSVVIFDSDYFGAGKETSIVLDSTYGQLLIDKSLTINGSLSGGLNVTIYINVSENSADQSIFSVTETGEDGTILTINNVNFIVGNGSSAVSADGGLIDFAGTELDLTSVSISGMNVESKTVEGKTVGGHGGAIFMETGTLNATSTVFIDNSASLGGGAVAFAAGTNGVFINTTLSENAGANGSALYLFGAVQEAAAASVTLANVTAVESAGSIVKFADSSASATALNSILYGTTDMTKAYYSIFSADTTRTGDGNITGATSAQIFGTESPVFEKNVYKINVQNTSLYSIQNGVMLGRDENGNFAYAQNQNASGEWIWINPATKQKITGTNTYSAISTDQVGNVRGTVTLTGASDPAGYDIEDKIFDKCYFRSVAGTRYWHDAGAFELSMDNATWISAKGWRVTAPDAGARSIEIISSSNMIINRSISLDQLTNNGTLTIQSGTVTIVNGEGVDFQNNGIFTIGSAGLITMSTGADWQNDAASTVTYQNGTVLAVSYGTLNLSTGTITIGSGAVTANTLTVRDNARVTVNADSGELNVSSMTVTGSTVKFSGARTLNVAGGLSVENGSTVDFKSATVTVGGNLTVKDTASVDFNTATVTLMAGFSAANMDLITTNKATFNYAQTSGTQSVLGGAYASLNLTGSSKTLAGDISASSINVAAGTAVDAGTKIISVSGTLTVGSPDSFDISNATVVYNGAAAQTIAGLTYNNLAFSGTGAKTIAAGSTVRVNGSFDVQADMTVEKDASLIIAGSVNLADGHAYSAPGSVEYISSADQTIGDMGYGSLTLRGSGVKTFASAMTINGALTVVANGAITVKCSASSFGSINISGTGADDSVVLSNAILTGNGVAANGACVTVTGVDAALSGLNVNETAHNAVLVTGNRVSVENSCLGGNTGFAVKAADGAEVTVINSTITRNTGSTAAVIVTGNSAVNLINSTVAGNFETGVNVASDAAFRALNSIIAYNYSSTSHSDFYFAATRNVTMVKNVLGSFASGSRRGSFEADNTFLDAYYTSAQSWGTALFNAYELANGVYVPVITTVTPEPAQEDPTVYPGTIVLPTILVGKKTTVTVGIEEKVQHVTTADNGASVYLERNVNGIVTGSYYILPKTANSVRLFGAREGGTVSVLSADQNGTKWNVSSDGATHVAVGSAVAIPTSEYELSLVVDSTVQGKGVTLFDALANAQALGGGTITFASNITNINLNAPITLADITTGTINITIDASAISGGVTLTAASGFRVFDLDTSTLEGSNADIRLSLVNISMAGNGTVNGTGAAISVTAPVSQTHSITVNMTGGTIQGFSGKSIIAVNGGNAGFFAHNTKLSGNTGHDISLSGGASTAFVFVSANAQDTTAAATQKNGSSAPLTAAASLFASAGPAMTFSSNAFAEEKDREPGSAEAVSATTCFSILGKVSADDAIAPDSTSVVEAGSEADVSVDNSDAILKAVTDNIAAVESAAAEARAAAAAAGNAPEDALEEMIAGLDLSKANMAKSELFRDSFDEAVAAMLTLS